MMHKRPRRGRGGGSRQPSIRSFTRNIAFMPECGRKPGSGLPQEIGYEIHVVFGIGHLLTYTGMYLSIRACASVLHRHTQRQLDTDTARHTHRHRNRGACKESPIHVFVRAIVALLQPRAALVTLKR